ncbi:MAG: nitroreductase family protein [Acidobacteriota bacterium]|jgi:nitroreductase
MTNPEIHPLLESRWSPKQFTDRPVSPEDLRTLFEAARWAPSSFNAQPWAFIVGTRDEPEAWNAVLETLAAKNQEWASSAPVLFLAVAQGQLPRRDRPNRHAFHDVGQAVAHLTVQASAMGLAVHQMGGFYPDKARETFGIPEDWEAVSVSALGYPDAEMPDERSRKGMDDMIFAGRWGERASWLDD